MTANDIKNNLACQFNLNPKDIGCFNCAKWGYNNGRVLNSYFESRCLRRPSKSLNAKTVGNQFCAGFIPKK